jgi:hypothetical protein
MAFFLALFFRWDAARGHSLSMLHLMSRSCQKEWNDVMCISMRKAEQKAKNHWFVARRTKVKLTFCWWRSWHRCTWRSMQALFCTGIAFLPRSIADSKIVKYSQ